MFRKLITNLNRSLAAKLVSARRKQTSPVKIWFEPDMNNERSRTLALSNCILGETVDLSRSGISFLVSAIRSQEKYLVGQDRKLNVEIDLPNGKVQMKVIGRRYEKVGIHISTEKFLVGAEIIEFVPGSEDAYHHFLKNGKRAAKGRGSLELGID